MATDEMELSSGASPLEQRTEEAERDERGRFTKGNPHRWTKGTSGNSTGRRDAMTDTLRRKLHERHDHNRTRQEAVIDALINEAANGSVRAAELIFLRLEGKLPATIDLQVTRSEYEQYNKKIQELQEIAYARGTPISRGKAVALLATTDPRIKQVIQDDGNE